MTIEKLHSLLMLLDEFDEECPGQADRLISAVRSRIANWEFVASGKSGKYAVGTLVINGAGSEGVVEQHRWLSGQLVIVVRMTGGSTSHFLSESHFWDVLKEESKDGGERSNHSGTAGH